MTWIRSSVPLAACAALLLHAAAAPNAAGQPAAGEPPPQALTLGAALQLAVAASRDVAIAATQVERADAEWRRARADRLPQLFGTVGYTRTLATEFGVLRNGNGNGTGVPAPPGPEACAPFAPDPALPFGDQIAVLADRLACVAAASPIDFGDFFGDLPFGRTNQYTLGLGFTQPVYTGGRIGAAGRAAGAQRDAAEIGLGAARAQAVLEAAEAYFDAALTDRLVVIAEATVDQADATLRQADISLQAGVVAEFEVLRARVARDNGRSALVNRRAERDVAHLRLKQLLQLPADQPVHLVTPLADEPLPAVLRFAGLADEPPPTAGIEAASVEDRAPVQQAAAALRAQESLLRIAASQRLPQVTFSSNFARVAYPGGALPAWDDFRTNWTLDVTVQVPLFTGGRLGADVRAAEADVAGAEARLRHTRDLAALDARHVRAQLVAAQAAWDASAGTAEQAAEAVRIVEIRFREGISTQLEVADTQLQYQQAEINRAQAARDLQVARIRTELLPFLPLGAPGVPLATPPQTPAPAPAPQPAAPGLTAPGGVIRAADGGPALSTTGRVPR